MTPIAPVSLGRSSQGFDQRYEQKEVVYEKVIWKVSRSAVSRSFRCASRVSSECSSSAGGRLRPRLSFAGRSFLRRRGLVSLPSFVLIRAWPDHSPCTGAPL
jgi:hypothetical protein